VARRAASLFTVAIAGISKPLTPSIEEAGATVYA
jgi:hypothetical protein